MTVRTALTDRIGIRLPVIQAPMAGGWTTPALAAAVSNAGGLGMLPASRLSAAQLDELIQRTSALTPRPFGVNFQIVAPDPITDPSPALDAVLETARSALGLSAPAPASGGEPETGELVDLALARGVRVLSFAMGDPAEYVARIQRVGGVTFAAATTVVDARRVEAAGADFVVAQGAEAGGHRSTIDLPSAGEAPLVGTMALVPQVVDAVRCPVVAAGGIMDGRGVLAALALGASGAQLGTRFLVAAEANVFSGYRERLLAAVETDTTVTRAFTGRAARSIRNRFIEHFERMGATPLPWPHQRAAAGDIYSAAAKAGDADWAPLLAGQGLRMARDVEPAEAIVAGIERDMLAALERLRERREGP